MRRLLLSLIIFISLFSYTTALENKKKLTLLVQPFSDSGDRSSSWISKGISDTVTSDLSRIRSINVVTEEDRRRALREMKLAMTAASGDEASRNTGLLTGADIIVTGNCTVLKNSIYVTGKIINADSGKIIATIKLDNLVSEIFTLQERIVTSIIEESAKSGITGLILPEISREDKISISMKTTPELSSYELYSRALAFSESNTNEALALCEKAIESQPDYYEAIILAAYIDTISGRPSIGLSRIERAKAILKRKGSTSDLTMAFVDMNRAPILFSLKRYKDALNSYKSAKLIFEKSSMIDSSNYVSVLIGIGSTQRCLGDNSTALQFSNQAIAAIEKLGMTKSAAYGWALLNTGIIYSVILNYNEAIKIFTKASDTFSVIGLSQSQGASLTNAQIGFAYYHSEKFEESLKYFLSSVTTASKLKIDNDENYAWYYWYISLIYFDKKIDAKKALPYMERSVKLFKDSGSAELMKANDYLLTIKNKIGK